MLCSSDRSLQIGNDKIWNQSNALQIRWTMFMIVIKNTHNYVFIIDKIPSVHYAIQYMIPINLQKNPKYFTIILPQKTFNYNAIK